MGLGVRNAEMLLIMITYQIRRRCLSNGTFVSAMVALEDAWVILGAPFNANAKTANTTSSVSLPSVTGNATSQAVQPFGPEYQAISTGFIR